MATEDKKKSHESSVIAKAYLFSYNALQTIGWFFIFLKLITHVFVDKNGPSLYETEKWLLMVFQNGAVLEILHAATRIVPSNPIITTQQVMSRVWLVCGALLPAVAAQNSYGLPLALMAWSITEVIRYGYYSLNLINAVPKFLIWLRYSTFIILYPIGVTGELLCLYSAFTEFHTTQKWSINMPNTYNVTFSYAFLLLAVMMSYIPLFPPMYIHMLSQRKKFLNPKENTK